MVPPRGVTLDLLLVSYRAALRAPGSRDYSVLKTSPTDTAALMRQSSHAVIIICSSLIKRAKEQGLNWQRASHSLDCMWDSVESTWNLCQWEMASFICTCSVTSAQSRIKIDLHCRGLYAWTHLEHEINNRKKAWMKWWQVQVCVCRDREGNENMNHSERKWQITQIPKKKRTTRVWQATRSVNIDLS